jgi:hypothetical protein
MSNPIHVWLVEDCNLLSRLLFLDMENGQGSGFCAGAVDVQLATLKLNVKALLTNKVQSRR